MNINLKINPNGAVQFAETTKCRAIELLKWPDVLGVRQAEGMVDDNSLHEWLTKVFMPAIVSISGKHVLNYVADGKSVE
jgi:hypothetical protein